MNHGAEEIIGRLPGVAPTTRRIDRDARRALMAVAAVTMVFAGLAIIATPSGRQVESPAASTTTGATSPDLRGALERLRVPTAEPAKSPDETPAVPATRPSSDGYQSIEAIAPGRRT